MKIDIKKCAPALMALPIVVSIAMAVNEHRKRKQDAKRATAKLKALVASVNEKDEEIRRLENKLNAEKWFGDTWKWMLEEEWKKKGVDPDDFKLMLKRCEQTGEMVLGCASDEEKTEED